MPSSLKSMWLSCFMASCMVAMATAAGNEYLPPKGYNYDKPPKPFTLNYNTKPTSGPFTVPTRPSYLPPQHTTYRPPASTSHTYVPQTPPTPHPHHPHHDDHHDDHHHDHHHHHEPGMPFDFSYAVNEDGNDFSHNAISDGDITRGEYRVALPDGRTQIVKYTADWKNGFNAEVSYEGEARYPDQPSRNYGNGPSSGPGQPYVPPSQGGGYQY